MANEITPEVKLYIIEQIAELRKEIDLKNNQIKIEFRSDLDNSKKRGTTIFAAIASVIGILTVLGVWQFGKAGLESAADDWAKTKGLDEIADNIKNWSATVKLNKDKSEQKFNELRSFVDNSKNLLVLSPVGAIIPYSGDLEKISNDLFSVKGNKNWMLCNGALFENKRLPDLRDSFIKGLANDENLMNKGGRNSDIHFHSGITDYSNHIGPSQSAKEPFNTGILVTEKNHNHNFSTSNRSDSSNKYNNAPSFISLNYIMRIN